jgi:antitoxin ChpS
MAHLARLRKVGGSVMVAIPKSMLETLDLKQNAAVALSIDGGKLVIDPRKRRRYSLDDLLAQCRPSPRRSRADRVWTTGKAVGRELI